jgi:hypothetical protein
MATGTNAELARLSGRRSPCPGDIGVARQGACADLLLVNGDPVTDNSLIARPEDSLLVNMKVGVIYRNTLAERREQATPSRMRRRVAWPLECPICIAAIHEMHRHVSQCGVTGDKAKINSRCPCHFSGIVARERGLRRIDLRVTLLFVASQIASSASSARRSSHQRAGTQGNGSHRLAEDFGT